MKHDTTWHLIPTLTAAAAKGVARLLAEEAITNAFGVRLFRG